MKFWSIPNTNGSGGVWGDVSEMFENLDSDILKKWTDGRKTEACLHYQVQLSQSKGRNQSQSLSYDTILLRKTTSIHS